MLSVATAMQSLTAQAADRHVPDAETSPASAPQGADEGNLLGDLGGLRPWLTKYGGTFDLKEISEVLGNVTGGSRTGVIYEGLTDATLTLDFRSGDREPGGVLVAHALQIHGRGLTRGDLHNLDTASNIEATATTRLRELWYEQHVDGWLHVRFGQQSADTEFIISSGASNFINGTFGWPALPAADLPSGGPAYPLGTPGIRARVAAFEGLTVLVAAFNGDPAGRGNGDPQRRDASGTAFRTSDGLLAIAEVQYSPAGSSDNPTYKLGAWFNTQPFDDLRRDFAGNSLASPASLGRPLSHSGDFSVYGIIDQPLFRGGDNAPGFDAFLRVMGAPGDRNLIDFYLDGGVTVANPFGREKDTIGLAVAYSRIGSGARRLDSDTARFTGQPYPVRSAEILIEATYLIQVLPWWQLQPDLQYVINPGGGIPDPAQPVRLLGDALVLGLRTTITF